jgi:hypothetical protein
LRSEKQRSKKTAIAIDVECWGSRLFGVNLMRIPGISEGTLLKSWGMTLKNYLPLLMFL